MNEKYNSSMSDSMNSLAFNIAVAPKEYDIMMKETNLR